MRSPFFVGPNMACPVLFFSVNLWLCCKQGHLVVETGHCWTLTDKKGDDGELPFLIISRDLGLGDQFWVKFKPTRERKDQFSK